MTKPKIAIILLNYNGEIDTLECLESIKKINYLNFQTIIVDNASNDNLCEIILKNYPEIHLIANSDNFGFAEGNNIGIRYALKNNFDFIFLLNNDTIVDSEILNAFISASIEKPKAGILGAKIYQYQNKEIIDHFGGFWDKEKAEFKSLANGEKDLKKYSKITEVDYVCGCSFFVKAQAFKEIGLLEKDFFLIWEESDFCTRAKRNGFKIYAVPKALLWHKISASFLGKPHMHYYWWRNRLLWIKRNQSNKERLDLYKNILFKEIFKVFRHYLLKSIQIKIESFFLRKKISQDKINKHKRYKAGVRGILDFFFSRFGKGPEFLTKK